MCEDVHMSTCYWPLAGASYHQRRWIIGAFRVVALFEGFTWAGLLVGMVLKHLTHTTELGVAVFGALHGGAFVAYCALAVIVAVQQRWRVFGVLAIALAAAVPPFGTLLFDRWAVRHGHLTPAAAPEPAPG